MAVTVKSLALNDLIAGTAAGSADTLYTANNGIAQISQATAYNKGAGANDLYVYVMASGGSPGTDNILTKISVPAGESVVISKLVGHHVPKSGFVAMYAATTNEVTVTLSGVEFN